MVLVAALVGGLSGIALSAWLIQGLQAPAPLGLPTTLPTSSPAPAFALPGLNGEMITLSDYRGQVVLVNFWASWCGACKRQIPMLQKVAAAYEKKDVAFVMVSGDNRAPQEQVLKVAEQLGDVFIVDRPARSGRSPRRGRRSRRQVSYPERMTKLEGGLSNHSR